MLIDSTDIVDCKLKLILGLIWTLILHYSISMPMWDGDLGNQDGKGLTPKQRYVSTVNSSCVCVCDTWIHLLFIFHCIAD